MTDVFSPRYTLPLTSVRALLDRYAGLIARLRSDEGIRVPDSTDISKLSPAIAVSATCWLWKWVAGCRAAFREHAKHARIELKQEFDVYVGHFTGAIEEGRSPIEAAHDARSMTGFYHRDAKSRLDGWTAAALAFDDALIRHAKPRVGPPWKLWDEWVGNDRRAVLLALRDDPPAVEAHRESFLHFAASVVPIQGQRDEALRESVQAMKRILRREDEDELGGPEGELTAAVWRVLDAVARLQGASGETLTALSRRTRRSQILEVVDSDEVRSVLEDGADDLSRDPVHAAAIVAVAELAGISEGSLKKILMQADELPSSA